MIFSNSTYVQDSQQYVASLPVVLAFLVTGHMHVRYHKTLDYGAGISALHLNAFYTVAKDAYAHI